MFEPRALDIGSFSFTSRTSNNKRNTFLESVARSAIAKSADSAHFKLDGRLNFSTSISSMVVG